MAPQLRTESASIVSTTVAWSARMLPRNSLQVAAITRWKQLWASSSMMECQTAGTGNPSLKRTITTTGLLRVSQKTITLLLSTTQAKISRNVLEWNLQFDQLKNKSFSHNFSLTIQKETGDYYKWNRYWQTNMTALHSSILPSVWRSLRQISSCKISGVDSNCTIFSQKIWKKRIRICGIVSLNFWR